MPKRCIGAVVPKQDLVAVFYEEDKLIREEVVSLVIMDVTGGDVIAEPLSLCDLGLFNSAHMASYLGIEKKNKPLSWSEGIKELEEKKKKAQEDEKLSKLSPEELQNLIEKEEKKERTQKKKS